MRIDVFTIFPGIFDGPLSESIIKRARERGLISVELHDIRQWSTDRHRSVDDYPYGGGPGMVMMAPPVVAAVEAVLGDDLGDVPILAMSPSGDVLTQRLAEELATEARLALICGRYEGMDERIHRLLATREVSIGDYVLSGGELAAAVVVDVVARLVPGVIQAESAAEESHSTGLLEYPQYTRPPEYRGAEVPDVLLSGNHGRIANWRRQQALRRTRDRRPDLLARMTLSPEDRRLLDSDAHRAL
ncbi:MAG TPA: tRNA (guanosine(37)-N1)-methyltransferase TrmD [Thermomicrobiaceae bacterium]|nr:tRNA (guanosine(37)-N1)-methyltransferase TrmD [Thermomicrobiaceae bacterium]